MELDINLMRQMIIDHYENPRQKIKSTDDVKKYYSGHSDSPSCIDNINAFVKIENNTIVDVKFDGIGCAICTSSTDIMAKQILNKTVSEASDIIKNYNNMILNKPYDEDKLSYLAIYKNVYKQANRIKCALTGIWAIEKALGNYESKK